MMRATLLTASLRNPGLANQLPWQQMNRSPFTINGIETELIQVQVAREDVLPACELLAGWLLPTRWYAQLADNDSMYVVFPAAIALVRRGDPGSVRAAQQIGRLFKVPHRQMQFLAMFDEPNVDLR
jgi:hypothetical protein